MNQSNYDKLYDKLKEAALEIKAKQIRLCQEYIAGVKNMGYSENSTSIRYWQNTLEGWEEVPTYIVMQSRDAIKASGLNDSEVEEVLANL